MLLLGVSCSNEDVIPSSEPAQELEIVLDAGSFRTVVSRAGSGASADVVLKNVTARTISSGGGILQDNISVTNLRWNGNNTYSGSMTVNEPSKVSKVCFLANCYSTGKEPKVMDGYIQTQFTPGTASDLTEGIPMWGVTSWSKGTNLSAELTRAVAAAKFVSKVQGSTFQLNKVYLYHATDKVNVCSSDWTEKAKQFELPGEVKAEGSAGTEFYFPEFREQSDDTKRTCFVLEATYNGATTFYRIDFYKNGAYFLPQRNSRYVFNILEVSQKGYNTKDEALRNTGANVQKKILIDIEDNSNEVATDGTYRFSFGAVNTAVLNPTHFLITTFETDNNSQVTVKQMESGKNWLSNLKVESKGSERKQVTEPDGTKKSIIVYKWEVYGDFSSCDQLKTESPVWGRRTQQVMLTCGRFEKKIGVTQSLMPLTFVNYKEYVKVNDSDVEDRQEIEVNTLEYDQMNLEMVKRKYYRGLDLRPKPHKLRVWIKWDACSAGQNFAMTDLNLKIKVMKMNDSGQYTITESTKKISNMDRTRNGKVYFDIDMLQVLNSSRWCKNWVEIVASTESSVDTKLYVEQRYIQDEDNRIPYLLFNRNEKEVD